MRAVALVTAVLLLSGCVGWSTGERPEAWQVGEELLAHSTGRAHSGAFDARVFPAEDSTLAKPASCKAYRADKQYSGDQCTVMTSTSEHWFPIGDPPWGLWGDWEGRGRDTADDPDPDLPRILVAFDAEGTAVAYWDGALHPQSSHSTE